MPLRKPLVIVGGQVQQIQSGDTLDAVVAEVDIVDLTNNEVSPIVKGTPVYVDTNDTVKEAQADASGTVEVVGLVYPTSIAPAATGWIITDGVLNAATGEWDAVTGDVGGLTAGAIYYLDEATVGMLTTTAPTTTGNFVARVGKAISTTNLEITISQPILL
jgi:hypothetical protein